mmetsp:Transcript_6210/g.15890  ORF Transcript_6210/g.15890 Transcript_6210/m.15890 type:complete len:241 (-) Transcript_6210:280-1002(-)
MGERHAGTLRAAARGHIRPHQLARVAPNTTEALQDHHEPTVRELHHGSHCLQHLPDDVEDLAHGVLARAGRELARGYRAAGPHVPQLLLRAGLHGGVRAEDHGPGQAILRRQLEPLRLCLRRHHCRGHVFGGHLMDAGRGCGEHLRGHRGHPGLPHCEAAAASALRGGPFEDLPGAAALGRQACQRRCGPFVGVHPVRRRGRQPVLHCQGRGNAQRARELPQYRLGVHHALPSQDGRGME